MIAPPLSPENLADIKTQFPAHETQAITDLLLSYGDEIHHREVERIRRNILKLSQGSLEKAREWLTLAKRDFRDVIVSAEYYPIKPNDAGR